MCTPTNRDQAQSVVSASPSDLGLVGVEIQGSDPEVRQESFYSECGCKSFFRLTVSRAKRHSQQTDKARRNQLIHDCEEKRLPYSRTCSALQ